MTMAAAMRGFVAGVLVLGALVSWGLSHWLGWPGAVAAAVAIAIVVHALAIAGGCVMSHAAGRSVADRPTLLGWLRAWPGATAISMRNMYLDMPWRHRWPAHLPEHPRGAVLLVHGYGCNRGMWHGLHTWLARQGWAVDAVDLEPPLGDIDAFGRQVADAVKDLCEASGQHTAVVIGHSMGGLAARAALRAEPGTPIAHVVTIGTPHHGTWHARFGQGICTTQMLPGCDWLQKLARFEAGGAGLPAPPSRFTCIASHHDNVVSPAPCALLEGAPSLVRSGVGHMALVHDARVRRFIAARLEHFASPRM